MASNSFGHLFKITTWGESHGKAIGVVVDGCPAGVKISEEEINQELFWRTPGRNAFTSPRKEPDQAVILSGVFEGYSTGAPISIIIWNQNAESSAYDSLQSILRPGHATCAYLQKYGRFDHRGGGRASARETACRVAAGAIAKKILSDHNVVIVAYLKSMGSVQSELQLSDVDEAMRVKLNVRGNPFFCASEEQVPRMERLIEEMKREGDSIGGVVEAVAFNVPAGWGDPIYEKLEANLAKAMLSLPACKGFEIGSGFEAANMRGSNHNDQFYQEQNQIKTKTNHAGGTLAGISTGMPLVIRAPFKPASSINREQTTLNLNKETVSFSLPEGSRHDPCVAIRAVPVVEAMVALVLVDALLMNKSSLYSFPENVCL